MPDVVDWAPQLRSDEPPDGLQIVEQWGCSHSRDRCRVSGQVAHGFQESMIRPLPRIRTQGNPLTLP